jgi:SH3-like domain-containing protein
MRKEKTAIIALIVLAVGLAIGAAQILVVKVQTTQLRNAPQFFGPALASLKVGDKLEKLGEANGWVQVRTAAGTVGWIHSSAVGESSTTLASTGQPVRTQASANEVALAGRGFNQQVEDSYKAKHTELSFVWVDRMVQIKIAAAQLEDFLRRGHLGGVK